MNRKVSSIKSSTIYFQTTPVPLESSAETSTEVFSLPSQPGDGAGEGALQFLLRAAAEPHPHLPSVPTTRDSTMAPLRPAKPRKSGGESRSLERCGRGITALMTAVLYGTVAVLCTGQSKLEPF